jgi:hypothetical protein
MTARVAPLLSQAFDDLHDTSGGGAGDPIRASLLNGAKLLQDRFVAILGTDLTVQNNHNPFWHTGNPCSMAAVPVGDLLKKQPWTYLWRTAEGKSGGKGNPGLRKVERYEAHVARFIAGPRAHMWPLPGR